MRVKPSELPAKLPTSVGGSREFDYKDEHGVSWVVHLSIEADDEPYETEPYVGVVVEVGRLVEVHGTGWTKSRFVALGDSSLWRIDGLDADYCREVAAEQLSEALIEARLVIAELRK